MGGSSSSSPRVATTTALEGTVLGVYKCRHEGSVPMHNVDGAEQGLEATEKAWEVLQDVSLPKCKVQLVITSECVYVIDPSTGVPLSECLVKEIVLVTQQEVRKMLTVLVRVPSLDFSVAHFFTLPSVKASDQVLEHVYSLRKIREVKRARGSVATLLIPNLDEDDEEEEDDDEMSAVKTGNLFGLAAGTYFGSCVSTEGKDGKKALEGALRKPPTDQTSVIVQVGTEGIRVVDALGYDLVTAFPLRRVWYCNFCRTKRSKKNQPASGFAFVTRNEAVKTTTIHFFDLGVAGANTLADALQGAMAAAKAELDELKDDPFKARGEARLKVSAALKAVPQIARDDLKPVKSIGSGSFGLVYMAVQKVADGQGEDGTNKARRAVKMMRKGGSKANRTEFVHECEVTKALESEHLPTLFGVSIEAEPCLMVLEFLPYGDLRSVVQSCAVSDVTLTAGEVATLLAGSVRGLEFMHEQGWLHRDVAARNVLVGANSLCKLSDFGRCSQLETGQSSLTDHADVTLPIKWCAPEVLIKRTFSRASDIWAVGVLMWEVLSGGEAPMNDVANANVANELRRGVRMATPPGSDSVIASLMQDCWKDEPSERPTAASLKDLLQAAADQAAEPARDVGALLSSEGLPSNALDEEFKKFSFTYVKSKAVES
eukprot:m.82670 g.82670  ORF g.82670 m.82670 type:complete len:657 (-) comp14738_c0_seq1:118-2088(-)